MANANLSLAEKMDRAEMLILGAQKQEVLAIMSKFSYGAAQVKPIDSVLTAARQKISRFDLEYAEKLESTASAVSLRADFKSRFRNRFEFSKIAFAGDAPIFEALRLNESIKKTDTALREQGERFYTTLRSHSAWISMLAQFAITDDLIDEDIQILADLKAAESAQMKECEDAIFATADRDKTLEELFDWTERYKKVANLALAGNDKLLGMLGL